MTPGYRAMSIRQLGPATAAAMFVAATLSILGCGSPPIAAPTSYDDYNHKDGTFACHCPADWEADGGGKNGPIWAKFTSGAALIRIRGDLAGSLAGDVLGGRASNELPKELQAVHKLHVMAVDDAKNEFSGYEEVGDVEALESKIGPARISEFTASTTFGSRLHGYRATLLGHDKRLVAYCVCPESDWAALEPAFRHVLGSFKRGFPE